MATNNKTVLSLGAHPDDAEFFCAGTLALLHQKGWDVHIATMTPGDCGTVQYSREEISRIRRAEATLATSILDGTYHCLECDDIFILYDRPTLLKTIELMRKVKPAIVITTSPSDYMVDHEMASKLAQTACFACGIVNVETPGAEPFEPIPHLYYMDPAEQKDKYGMKIKAGMIIDITDVAATKEKMLCCHESQRHWLMTHHGMDEYVNMMKDSDKKRGAEINSAFAEGFRQHLGHAYPQDNILKTELGDLVHIV
jgi:LmbE family N-acetylglucosaminyl deacetylase